MRSIMKAHGLLGCEHLTVSDSECHGGEDAGWNHTLPCRENTLTMTFRKGQHVTVSAQYTKHVHRHTHTHTHTHTYKCTYIHIYMHTQTHTAHTQPYVCMHTHKHTGPHTHT